VERLGAEVVFCCSERSKYTALLEALGRKNPDLPVIVVSRVPDVSEWLDAIEAGASDYCAAPFESNHIRWILEASRKRKPQPIVRAAG
jgi:DNA-binding NtrC family response regulator